MRKNNQKGFTLIELIIVIVILGIIAVIAVPNYVNIKTTAEQNALKSTLGTIRASISLEHAQNLLSGNDSYPSTITGNMFEQGEIPNDPVNNTQAVATSNVDPLKGTISGTTGGWIYNSSTGEVRVNHQDYDEY